MPSYAQRLGQRPPRSTGVLALFLGFGCWIIGLLLFGFWAGKTKRPGWLSPPGPSGPFALWVGLVVDPSERSATVDAGGLPGHRTATTRRRTNDHHRRFWHALSRCVKRIPHGAAVVAHVPCAARGADNARGFGLDSRPSWGLPSG